MKLLAALAGGLATVAVAGAMVLTSDPSPAAPAPAVAKVSACEHRGLGHREKHGGIEDDRYHRANGEPVTCQDKDNGPSIYAGADTDDHEDSSDRDRRRSEDSRKDDSKDSPLHRRDTSVKPNLFDLIS